jgi:hypothetical protein
VYGITTLPDTDNGTLAIIAKSLPDWNGEWMQRRFTPTGKTLPLLYNGTAAMVHFKCAAEIIAAVRGAFHAPNSLLNQMMHMLRVSVRD